MRMQMRMRLRLRMELVRTMPRMRASDPDRSPIDERDDFLRQPKTSDEEPRLISGLPVPCDLLGGFDPGVDGHLMDLAFKLDGFKEKDIASLYEIDRKATAFVTHESREYIIMRVRMAEILSALARNLQSYVYLDKAFSAYDYILRLPMLSRIPFAREYVHSCIVGSYLPFFEYEVDFDPAFDAFEIAKNGYRERNFPINHALLNGWVGVLHAWTALSLCVTAPRASKKHAGESLVLLDRARQGTLQLNRMVEPGLIDDSARIAREILEDVDVSQGKHGDNGLEGENPEAWKKKFRKARDIVISEGKKYGKQSPLDRWCG
jgi:hypothetical protein